MIENLGRQVPRRGVRIEWHKDFNPTVSKAFARVSGEEWVPADLVESVLRTPGPHRKRIAVLYRHDEPWAVVPLRLQGRFWEPLLQGVLPEIPAFPCTGSRAEVPLVLGVNLGLWASTEPSSSWQGVRWGSALPCYEIDLEVDPERHWRSTDLWKTLVQARRRTSNFELVRDNCEACSWGVRGWRDRFYHGELDQVSSKWNDRITATQWGLEHGWSAHSWHLRDGDRWVAGATAFERDGRLSIGTLFRDPEYDWFSGGNRSLYEAVMWARANGIRTVSFGNSFDYKRRWAKPSGTHWDTVIAPWDIYAWDAGVQRIARTLWKREDA